MKHFKRLIAAVLSVAMFSSGIATADLACENTGGCGYIECRQAPCLTPAIALGSIALVAIVAVALQDSHSSHGHCH